MKDAAVQHFQNPDAGNSRRGNDEVCPNEHTRPATTQPTAATAAAAARAAARAARVPKLPERPLPPDQHFNWTAAPGKLLIVIPGDEVKNEEELSLELPPRAVTAISTCISTCRPLLLKGANDYLSPGQNGRPKTLNNPSQQLAKFTFDGIGVRLTAHRFRRLKGKIFLDACPGQYEVVCRVLGQRSIETTMAYYAGEETRAAVG